MMSLVRTWLEWNKKEKLSDTRYNLGFFITKDEITSFYYTRQFDFYLMSLEKFNITSPDEEIGDNIVKNVQKLHKDLFQDRDKLQKYIRDEYPANVSTVLNSYYTDEVIRPFSFDDLLDKDGKNMRKLLESFDNDLNDLETNNLKLPKIILALLEKLYSYYHNKRSNVIDEDGLVIVRDLNGFYDDIVQENLLVPPLEDFVIASPKNPRNYPFIVKFKRKFIVSPVRLWIGYRLLHYALDKNRINNEMAKKYENESMIEIEDRLIKRGVVIVGKEIFTTKKGVELDLIGYCEDLILIIECKSFHPSPFFMMRRNRRYNNQFKRKIRKVERIKNWIFTKLTDSIPNDGEIKIDVYNHYEKCPAKLVFPMKYHKIDRNRIYYLYITQIKEYHEYHRNDLIQVWSGDL